MPVLGTYTFVGTLCIGGVANGCVAHGLPDQPDFAVYQGLSTFGAAVGLITRTAAALWWYNSGGSAVPGEAFAQAVHSVIR